MKKRIALIVAALACICASAKADTVYNQNLANETGLSYSKNYSLNTNTTPNAAGISRLSAQAIGSTATIAAATFNDGRVSTATITVASVSGLVLSSATDSITVAPITALLAQAATNQITVVSTSGLSTVGFTFNGNTLREGTDWTATTTTTGTAASIATALSKFQSLQVQRISNVVYATATIAGFAENSFTLGSSSPAAISTAATNFSGGHDPLQNSYITFNGNVLKQGYSWDVKDTSSGTATSIATALSLEPGVIAQAISSVVYATSTVGGVAGNAYTLSSSSSAYLAVGSAHFTGGVDNAVLTINGVKLTQGTDWNKASTAANTAKAISDAIIANSSLNTIVGSTWASNGIVYTTSTAVGTGANYSLVSSTPSQISLSHATYVGGANSAWAINTPTIAIASHGFTTALPVLYSAVSPAIGGLTNQTTYFAIVVDANDLQLATTSARAQAGNYITLTSSSVTGPHTYTLTPLNFTGTAGLQWQVSNDCSNYVNLTTTSQGVSVSSVTFASPYAAFDSSWDFGPVNYACIQAAVTGPTTGGLNLKVILNGKNP